VGPKVVRFSYTNYKGVTSMRTVEPIAISFGSTEFHPDRQWLMKGYDLDKQDYRVFALCDCNFKEE